MRTRFINVVKKYFQTIDLLEFYKKEAYIQGCNDTSDKFLNSHQELLDKIEQLTQQNIAAERRIRDITDDRVKQLEDTQESKCKLCRKSMENEQLRFKTRQMYLAEIINKMELLQQRMHQYSGKLIQGVETIISSAAKLSAYKTDLMNFEQEFDKIVKEAAPYLNMKLNDGTTDFFIMLDNQLDVSNMIEDKGKDRK